MKKLLVVLAVLLAVCLSLPALGGEDNAYESRKIESLGARVMGGVDLAVDINLPHNAALAPDGWFLTIMGVEAFGGISSMMRIIDVAKCFADYKDSFQNDISSADNHSNLGKDETQSPIMETRNLQFEEFKRLVGMVYGRNLDLDSQLRVDVLRLDIGNKRFGKLTVGAYAEGEAEVQAYGPNPDDIKQTKEGYADIGVEQDVARGLGHGDIGGQLAYGRAFGLPFDMELAAGIRARVFHRIVIPELTIQLNRFIKDKDDIVFPDGQFYDRGTGFGLDSYLVLAPHDPLFDTRVAVGVYNAYGQVWYDQAGSIVEMRRYSVGFAVSPLHRLDFDGLTLGVDAENLQKNSAEKITWQTGASCKIGSGRFNIVPATGYVFNRQNLIGDKINDIFAAGLTAHLFFLSLGGLYEFNMDTKDFNIGVRVAIEI